MKNKSHKFLVWILVLVILLIYESQGINPKRYQIPTSLTIFSLILILIPRVFRAVTHHLRKIISESKTFREFLIAECKLIVNFLMNLKSINRISITYTISIVVLVWLILGDSITKFGHVSYLLVIPLYIFAVGKFSNSFKINKQHFITNIFFSSFDLKIRSLVFLTLIAQLMISGYGVSPISSTQNGKVLLLLLMTEFFLQLLGNVIKQNEELT